MAKENENLDSEMETINLDEITDVDVLKEHYQKLDESYRDVFGKNKQLFERTKKAEGFELKDGKWTKSEAKLKAEPKEKVEPQPPKEPSQPNELDYGQKAFLKTYGIQGSDELALVKAFLTRTGDDLDTIVSDDIFLGKLQSLRDARESANAIPKSKGRSGQSNVTDIDLAVAKFKETGQLPTDFETAVKVKDALVKEDKGSGAIFK